MTQTAKSQFANLYAREHATTMKVLRAFPGDQGEYRPHEKSNTAKQLAWTFAIENELMLQALRGPLNLSAGFPKAPPTFTDAVEAYEKSAKEFMSTLDRTPEARLSETVQFFAGPGKMADYPVGDFLMFMFLDSIHHRGQMSVYLRPAGGKVPSIYGPSGDEPWM